MITRIEAKNYRCLRYISQALAPFQILVGPNASGKTTFLDVVSFISDILNDGLEKAITKRSVNFMDLTFAGKGGNIELAIECRIPDEVRLKMGENSDVDFIRYEISVGLNEELSEYGIWRESVTILKENNQFVSEPEVRTVFPTTYVSNKRFLPDQYYCRDIIKKDFESKDFFQTELEKNQIGGSVFHTSLKLGHKKSSLANLPEDESLFPASIWLKNFLSEEIQTIVLDSSKIRNASAPGLGKKFLPDGSNLPWIIEDLQKNSPERFGYWVSHIRSALPDVETIVVKEFLDTRQKYLKIIYNNGIEVPSWTASDGTLRFLALTVLAYLPNFRGVYLIEEPEIGIHPKIMESVYQSLSSVYDAQILLATHSPVILNIAELKDVLCFAKTDHGVTDIVRGKEHPMLRDWKGECNLSVLFASGVLG